MRENGTDADRARSNLQSVQLMVAMQPENTLMWASLMSYIPFRYIIY